MLRPSDKEHGVLRLWLLLSDHGAADRHDRGDDAVDALGALVLGRLQVAGGVLGDGDAIGETNPTPINSPGSAYARFATAMPT